MRFKLRSILAAVGILTGCGGGGSLAIPPPTAYTVGQESAKIKHVVIIVQENRSFDDLFQGFPGADTVSSGPESNGTVVTLQPQLLETGVDYGHFHSSFESAFDGGKMDGFDLEGTYGIVNGAYTQTGTTSPGTYSYVPRSEITPYWTLAQNFTLADRMFSANSGPSYTAHQYLIAGQSDDADGIPDGLWGCDAVAGTTVTVLNSAGQEVPGPFPCFTYPTLADEMDNRGISWRYYAPGYGSSGYTWSAFDAIRQIRFGRDWTSNVISPETTVLTDIAGGALADVSWIIPSQANSDHPISSSSTGPQWVASIVNAIGRSQYWNDTAIFIFWDDWGGFYEHVVPPSIDIMGLGMRVPLLVVSPYAKHGYISHVTHESGSVLHFTENVFGLPSLGTRDAVSDDLSDCFDFAQNPGAYAPLAVRLRPEFFLRQPRSLEPPDPI